MASLCREDIEVELAGQKASVIQWKRSIEFSEMMIKALEEKLKTMPKKQK